MTHITDITDEFAKSGWVGVMRWAAAKDILPPLGKWVAVRIEWTPNRCDVRLGKFSLRDGKHLEFIDQGLDNYDARFVTHWTYNLWFVDDLHFDYCPRGSDE